MTTGKVILISSLTTLGMFLVGTVVFAILEQTLNNQAVKITTPASNTIEGEYRNPEGLCKQVVFKDGYCTFQWFIAPQSGKYEIKGDHIYADIGGDFSTVVFKIIDENTIEGSAALVGTYKRVK